MAVAEREIAIDPERQPAIDVGERQVVGPRAGEARRPAVSSSSSPWKRRASPVAKSISNDW